MCLCVCDLFVQHVKRSLRNAGLSTLGTGVMLISTTFVQKCFPCESAHCRSGGHLIKVVVVWW